MKLRFAGHWLAFLWAITTRTPLVEAVKLARSAKATVFELIYDVLNGLGAEDTASALKEGGISRAIMCIFYPGGDGGAAPPMGDPLGDGEQFDTAVNTFKRVLNFIVALQENGIIIKMIVGPSCWVLGEKYAGMDWTEKKRRILKFYGALKFELSAASVKVAIEMLRVGEDYVFETVEQWKELIDALNEDHGINRFGAHWDSFHMEERGINQAASVQALDGRILHLHFNGVGRRPAGGEGDTIDWAAIIAALIERGYDNLTATNEPFCQVVRDNCAPLGEGLPPAVSEPGGMTTTRETLERCGVTIVA